MIHRTCLICICTLFILIIIFEMIYKTLECTYSPLMVYQTDLYRHENVNSSQIRIPRLIHQMYKTRDKSSLWNSTMNSVIEMNQNNFTYRRWSISEIDEFVKQNEPIFYYRTYKKYRYQAQRSDSFRYVLMYHIGGIYIDMDSARNHSFKDLVVGLESLDPKAMNLAAFPQGPKFGVDNDFLISSVHHPFYQQLISRLHIFNHNYLSYFWTIFFSTGPGYVHIQHRLFSSSEESVVRLIDNPVHQPMFVRRVNGGTSFDHDARLLVYIDGRLNQIFCYCNVCLVIMIVLLVIKGFQRNKFHHFICK